MKKYHIYEINTGETIRVCNEEDTARAYANKMNDWRAEQDGYWFEVEAIIYNEEESE